MDVFPIKVQPRGLRPSVAHQVAALILGLVLNFAFWLAATATVGLGLRIGLGL